MTDKEKSELKLIILTKIDDSIKKILELKELTKPIEPDCAIGRVSRMDAINNKSVNEAALRQKERQLKSLEFALEGIDSDKFGICISCGKAIPIGRILLMPGSKKCVKCASR